MDYEKKFVRVKRLGWRTVVKQRERFGWELCDAEEETTTETETRYEGRVSGDTVYIDPKTTTKTKVRVNLYFVRYPSDFKNLGAVRPIEWIYNVIFVLRRIVGALLTLAGIAALGVLLVTFLVGGINGGIDLISKIFMNFGWIFVAAWAGMIVAEVLLSLLAKLILKRR